MAGHCWVRTRTFYPGRRRPQTGRARISSGSGSSTAAG